MLRRSLDEVQRVHMSAVPVVQPIHRRQSLKFVVPAGAGIRAGAIGHWEGTLRRLTFVRTGGIGIVIGVAIEDTSAAVEFDGLEGSTDTTFEVIADFEGPSP